MENKSYVLIKESIDATLKFEKKMDSIDFNSYLEKNKEDGKIRDSNGYKLYEKETKQAFKYCDEIIKKNEIKKASFKLSDDQKCIRWLIRTLLEAKKTRLKARKQSERKKETKLYTDATHGLHRTFDKIARKYFDSQKGKNLIEDLNWAKVLYYNELAICYSGLVKSSMSLGYAEQSISLLEELYPQLKNIKDWTTEKLKEVENKLYQDLEEIKDPKIKKYVEQLKQSLETDKSREFIVEFYHKKLEKIKSWKIKEWEKFNSEVKKSKGSLPFLQVIKLYTFALYNKGEAERLLHNEDSAMRTFQRITELSIFVKNTDYISALLHKALILIDMGRGEEAIKAMKDLDEIREKQAESPSCQIKDVPNDYRIVDAKLEKVSAQIDRKEYEEAYNELKDFENVQWKYTFAQRKAKVCMLRLLNEFKKNRPEDYEKKVKLEKFGAQKKIKDTSGISYNEETKELTITLELEKNQKEDIEKLFSEDKEVSETIEKLWKELHPEKDKFLMIKKDYPKFVEIAQNILKDTIDRRDGDNFKKICTYLAEYFWQKGEEEKIKATEEALKSFYLYLFYNDFFERYEGLQKIKEKFEKSPEEIIVAWQQKDNSLLDLYKEYSKNVVFSEILDRVEDKKYLRDFFNLYLKYINERNEGRDKYEIYQEKDIIKRLRERLVAVYHQKDNLIELEQVEEEYKHFEEKCINSYKNGNRIDSNKSSNFIKDFFFQNIKDCMLPDSIVERMKRNTEKFAKKVVGRSCFSNEKEEQILGRLCVLRRWNSFTPALGSSVTPSKGGGYFLYFSYDDKFSNNKKTLGIVIDPGYDFLENFFSQGFRIDDIDVVLVSHAHSDHTDNLPSILSLFHEMNYRLGKYYRKKKTNIKLLTLVLSPGVFEHYNRIIKPSEEVLKDIVVVGVKGDETETPYKRNLNDNYEIKIKAFGTSHKDLSQFQSLGFKIIVNENQHPRTIIGYTGDARWSPNYNNWSKHFNDCTIVCAHLGSIVNILDNKDFCNTFCNKFKKNDNDNNCKKCKESGFSKSDVSKAKMKDQTRDENHLYLAGLTLFFNYLLNEEDRKLKLALISEFGEELKHGIRMDIHKKFDTWFKDNCKKNKEKLRCLPGDIGLEVDVFTGNVYCHCCNRFVERDRIEPIPYGKEEAICFVCKECESVLSSYQIGEKLKDYCENGRKLELADESK